MDIFNKKRVSALERALLEKNQQLSRVQKENTKIFHLEGKVSRLQSELGFTKNDLAQIRKSSKGLVKMGDDAVKKLKKQLKSERSKVSRLKKQVKELKKYEPVKVKVSGRVTDVLSGDKIAASKATPVTKITKGKLVHGFTNKGVAGIPKLKQDTWYAEPVESWPREQA